ncbi:MAG TPA: hypothetical protein VGC62_06755 [Pseudomonas sp.]|uniref:hypothetical protein n=1 Tax=Pseudomonas sp. TaxID=306 RepID=UPI002ED791B3
MRHHDVTGRPFADRRDSPIIEKSLFDRRHNLSGQLAQYLLVGACLTRIQCLPVAPQEKARLPLYQVVAGIDIQRGIKQCLNRNDFGRKCLAGRTIELNDLQKYGIGIEVGSWRNPCN